MEPEGRDREMGGRRLGAPRQPRISVETALAVVEDQRRRHEAFQRDLSAGPFALLAERRHPLVRAEMRRTRRSRWTATVLCVAVPLLASLIELAVPSPGGAFWPVAASPWLSATRVLVCFWPLVMFLGAAIRSAWAVLAERSDNTAMQIVLTSMPKRAIAAAKVLPHVRPFLWGSLAALPLYCLTAGWFPSGMSIWPLRMFVIPLIDRSFPSDPDAYDLLSGGLMCLTDLGAIWAAAHWGAALAVRQKKLPDIVGGALLKVFRLLVAAYAAFGVAMALGFVSGTPVAQRSILLGFVLLLGLSWWFIVLRPATRSAMEAFAWFDFLAMEEGDRPPGEPNFIWRDSWDETARP